MANEKYYADFQRLEDLKKFLGVTYQDMALQAGIKSPNSFYAVKAGKQGVSKKMAQSIVKRWPEVSEAWLLSGRGSMLVKDNEATTAPVSGEVVAIEKRVLDTIISQQETIRIQAATIQEMARQRGMGTAQPEEDAGCAVAG